MWELTKRISLRISSVLSKVEPEPGAGAGPLHRTFTPASALTKKYRLRNNEYTLTQFAANRER